MATTARRKPKNWNFFEKYTYYIPGVADMFILLVWLLVGALLGNVLTLILAAVGGQEFATTYGMMIAYPLQFIPAMIYASVKSRACSFNSDGIKLNSGHFGNAGGLCCAILAALATLALAFCSDAINSRMPEMPEYLKALLESLTGGPIWVSLISVSVFAPLFEEWLCRGTVLRGLLGKGIKPVWAIIISAAFFAVIHLNPWQAVPAFLLGCIFGYVYYRTGSLLLTMLMHSVNNAFAVLCSNIDSFSEMESWLDVLPGKTYWLLFAAFVLLIILIVRVFERIPLADAKGNCDKVPSIFEQQ